MRWTPHKYQERAIRWVLERAHCGLFLDPGLGKTSVTLAAYKLLRRRGFVRGALVIAPLRPCYAVWPAEAAKWDDFRGMSVGVLHGPKKAKVLAARHDVYVVNPEGLGWLFGALPTSHSKWPFDMLVVDESTRFKHTNTLRFKTLKPHLSGFKRRVILTGTPAPNGLIDLFGQCYVMDRGASFGQYVTGFRSALFTPVSGKKKTVRNKHTGEMEEKYTTVYEWRPQTGAPEIINARLADRALRLESKDYLELPPLVEQDVSVALPPKARKIYDKLEDELFLRLSKGDVTVANSGVLTMKCRQVANGGVYLDGGDARWENLHEAKTDAVEELVEELSGQPALVAYEFHHDLARLRRRFPAAPHIGSGVTMKRQREILAEWNAGKLPVLLGQPQSMAHGLNMQEGGRAVIFHSLIWNLEDYEQFIKRVWRQGQRSRVFVYHVVAHKTVDAAVLVGLRGKDRTQKGLLAALKSLQRG